MRGGMDPDQWKYWGPPPAEPPLIIFPGDYAKRSLNTLASSTTEYLSEDPARSDLLLSALPVHAHGTVPFSLSVDSEGFVVIKSLRDNKVLTEGTNFALTTFVPEDIYLDGKSLC